MRVIKNQLYKVNRYYGRSEFVEVESLDELAQYIGESDASGNIVMSVTEVNLDGTHPRVSVAKRQAYKDAVERTKRA